MAQQDEKEREETHHGVDAFSAEAAVESSFSRREPASSAADAAKTF
jgi:hypothetical protein